MAGSAFFTAANGLRNHQLRIDVVANNIANVNTAGYKASSVIFADVLSQTLRGASAPTGNFGGINPTQVGLGMQVASIHNLMSQSALENTGRQTDFAVNGSGFFVLTNGSDTFFSRAGDFNIDRDGRLVANNGFRVQGYNELTLDGKDIDPGSRIGDIIIEFGKKLAARATTELNYVSNLDASSFRFGSADNVNANFGTTGILNFAGAAEPWAIAVGDPVTAVSVGLETIEINGITITYDSSGAAGLGEAAQIVADAINIDPTLSPQVQATLREISGSFQVVVQAVSAGTAIDISVVSDPASAGLVVNLYNPPAEPGFFLVGNNTITVTDSKSATDTTTVPMGTGVNRPLAGDSFIINAVTVTLTSSAGSTDTAAQNAILVANAINSTLDISVTATANPNGTLTITQNFAGMQRQPAGAPPDAIDADIFIDATATPGLAARYGFITLDDWGIGALGPDAGIIDNGENAKVEQVFTPDDGSAQLVRFVEDWPYDRSAPAGPWAPSFYTASSLSNVQAAIEGAGATFPLTAGVNISIDELMPGQANFRTADAFVHTTSRIVYDSLGNPHNLTTTFTHVSENEWQYDLSLPEESNIGLDNTSGRMLFSPQGQIVSGNPFDAVSFVAPGADPTSIFLVFDGNGQTILGVTQFAAPTTTSAREQDGYTLGILSDFETDSSGTIVAFYNNGQRRPIARLALGTFANPEGLERVGDSSFRTSTNSGQPVLLQAGTGGAGVIFAGFLEQSNVDLALEFTNMIITQRGLQANSRVFTTQDEILNEIVNLKR
ncbi:flagellar hook-basal body complex protein [bacterium]|nr:flagellar hook-basal body complex protein [bacterium]